MKKIYIILLAVVMIFGSCISCFAVESFDCIQTDVVNGKSTPFPAMNLSIDNQDHVYISYRLASIIQPFYLVFVSVNGLTSVTLSSGATYFFVMRVDESGFDDDATSVNAVSSALVNPLLLESGSVIDRAVNTISVVYNDASGNLCVPGYSSSNAFGESIATASGITFEPFEQRNIVTSSVSVCKLRNFMYVDRTVSFNDLSVMLPSFGRSILSIWQSIINFIMLEANRITLLSVTAWLFVVGVGGVRKLVTGV